jgi:hypothetical protein
VYVDDSSNPRDVLGECQGLNQFVTWQVVSIDINSFRVAASRRMSGVTLEKENQYACNESGEI